MRIHSNLHLSYCTNIHSGETWEETFFAIQQALPDIKKAVAPNIEMGLGLRLSAQAAVELLQANALNKFSIWLEENGFYIFTINGFPFGGFHGVVVKDKVHTPDWTTSERLEYTKNLFSILSVLSPVSVSAGISTSPVSYKFWHTNEERSAVFSTAAKNFAEIVKFLSEIEKVSGKLLHLDIEPEPDGMIENVEELIHFYEQYLFLDGVEFLSKDLGISTNAAKKLILRHIQVCYDVCHFALVWEEPAMVLQKLKAKGIKIGKVQISAALEVHFTEDTSLNNILREELVKFAEPTYLHQVSLKEAGRVRRFTDLAEALSEPVFFESTARIHFHVPIFRETFGKLFSTQKDIEKILQLLSEDPFTEHLEVETYTWEVLPSLLKVSLKESIVRELQWVQEKIKQFSLNWNKE